MAISNIIPIPIEIPTNCSINCVNAKFSLWEDVNSGIYKKKKKLFQILDEKNQRKFTISTSAIYKNMPAAHANIHEDASGVSPIQIPIIVPMKLSIDDSTL